MTKTATFYEVDGGPAGTYWEYETNGYETVGYAAAEQVPTMVMQMATEGYKVEVLSQAWYVEKELAEDVAFAGVDPKYTVQVPEGAWDQQVWNAWTN